MLILPTMVIQHRFEKWLKQISSSCLAILLCWDHGRIAEWMRDVAKVSEPKSRNKVTRTKIKLIQRSQKTAGARHRRKRMLDTFKWYKIVRVGEASKPGPGKQRRNTRRCSEAKSRARGDARPKKRKKQVFVAETTNMSGWQPLLDYMAATDADVLMGQETMLRGEKLKRALNAV